MRGWDYNPAHRDARRRHRAPDRGPTPLTTSARVNRRRPCRKFSSTPIGLSIRYEGRHDHPGNRNSDAFEVDGLAVISQLGQDLKHNTAPERPLLVGGRVGPGARRSSCRRRDQRAAGGIGFRGRLLRTGEVLGSSAFIISVSAATYIVGRARNQPRVRHMGMDFIEATIPSEGITQLIKVAVRRDRPVILDGSDNPGYSFPSGLATITFAAATVFQQHFGWKAAVPT